MGATWTIKNSGDAGCHCHYCSNWLLFLHYSCAFSVLTLLVGQQEGHPACKKTEWWDAGMVMWLGRGEMQICIWPSWCHCHSLSLAPVNQYWYVYLSGFAFLVLAHLGSPGQNPEGHKTVVVMVVVVVVVVVFMCDLCRSDGFPDVIRLS